jgi:ATP-dependent Clp protease ATP-binding subunit ClpC
LFEKMTDQGRQVIGLAQQEARDLNHSSLGTEHLLLGLLAEGHGAAAEALTSLGVSLDVTRDAVAALIGRGRPGTPSLPEGHLPLTSQSRKVLELAVREALQLGHMHIGTGHLLLGITRVGDGAAVRVLVAHGTDMRLVRERVIQQLEDYPDGETEAVATGTPSWREVLPVLEAIQARLTAIERHLGITSGEPDGT